MKYLRITHRSLFNLRDYSDDRLRLSLIEKERNTKFDTKGQPFVFLLESVFYSLEKIAKIEYKSDVIEIWLSTTGTGWRLEAFRYQLIQSSAIMEFTDVMEQLNMYSDCVPQLFFPDEPTRQAIEASVASAKKDIAIMPQPEGCPQPIEKYSYWT